MNDWSSHLPKHCLYSLLTTTMKRDQNHQQKNIIKKELRFFWRGLYFRYYLQDTLSTHDMVYTTFSSCQTLLTIQSANHNLKITQMATEDKMTFHIGGYLPFRNQTMFTIEFLCHLAHHSLTPLTLPFTYEYNGYQHIMQLKIGTTHIFTNKKIHVIPIDINITIFPS